VQDYLNAKIKEAHVRLLQEGENLIQKFV